MRRGRAAASAGRGPHPGARDKRNRAAPGRARRREEGQNMARYGVIDLGSNTIRLVIYDVKETARRTFCAKDFKRLVNAKEMAGLAAFVQDGVFTEAGIKRAVSVLKTHAKHAAYFDCKRTDVFATAVLRNAANCAEAVAAIEQRTGLAITLLSERDEAHLGFVGAASSANLERGTLIDIGGGSTELTRIEGGLDYDDVSIGQGSLSSFARFVRGITPAPFEMDAIACSFRSHLKALENPERYRSEVLYGVGGSARAAAKVVAQIKGLESRPRTISANDIAGVLAACKENPNAFGHAALKASAERVHTIVPGCVILDVLCKQLGATRLEICKYGVREGYLIERMLGGTSVAPGPSTHISQAD